jgi:hypothetical protein
MKEAIIVLASALAVLSASACDDKKAADQKTEEPAAKNTTTNATAAPTANATATAAIDDADLATPADFEESATTAITKANYKTELATLEADLSKE